jgi:uncharacterized membrane protein YfcA
VIGLEAGGLPDAAGWVIVLAGALTAGFVTGFSGFGTALVASAFWYFALPAAMVPPLVTMLGLAAQLVGLTAFRAAFDWRRVWPFLAGGVPGVAAGVALLGLASPGTLRLAVGVLLLAYAGWQFSGRLRPNIGAWGGRGADGAVGFGGGVLGGFAGLSGPLPIVWLQLRGGPALDQRTVYQPFNLVILSLAGISMAAAGHVDGPVLTVAAACLPLSLGGAWLGVRLFKRVSEALFRRVVLGLLLVSGLALVAQVAAPAA